MQFGWNSTVLVFIIVWLSWYCMAFKIVLKKKSLSWLSHKYLKYCLQNFRFLGQVYDNEDSNKNIDKMTNMKIVLNFEVRKNETLVVIG